MHIGRMIPPKGYKNGDGGSGWDSSYADSWSVPAPLCWWAMGLWQSLGRMAVSLQANSRPCGPSERHNLCERRSDFLARQSLPFGGAAYGGALFAPENPAQPLPQFTQLQGSLSYAMYKRHYRAGSWRRARKIKASRY